jgi:hypothetical protein
VEKTTQRETSCCEFLTKYHSGDQIKETEIGRACSTYGAEERVLVGKP